MIIFPKGIEVSEIDASCLLNDIYSIEDWVNGAIDGKISNCRKRLIRQWQPLLFADPNIKTIPGNEDELIKLILSHPDYQDRAARDTELPDYVVDLGVTEEEILEAGSG
jgi:hypothetical protein